MFKLDTTVGDQQYVRKSVRKKEAHVLLLAIVYDKLHAYRSTKVSNFIYATSGSYCLMKIQAGNTTR